MQYRKDFIKNTYFTTKLHLYLKKKIQSELYFGVGASRSQNIHQSVHLPANVVSIATITALSTYKKKIYI